MRQIFFSFIDSLLPRSVALLPYRIALGFVSFILKLACGRDTQVWNRNSTRIGSFVFGVSDLDITVVTGKNFNETLFMDILKQSKRLFVLIGETNFYNENDLSWILKKANLFELKRDPVLSLPYLKDINPLRTNVEKFVFIQRMLFTDFRILHENPEGRQRKWRSYLKLIEEDYDDQVICVSLVMSVLIKLLGKNTEIESSLTKWLELAHKGETDFYRKDLGQGFRILAPHCQMWDEIDVPTFVLQLTEIEKMIIKRQIDWEIWGLYVQRHWLDRNQSMRHLSNLRKIYQQVREDGTAHSGFEIYCAHSHS